MSLATQVTNLATRISTEFRAFRTFITGTSTGAFSGLTTTAQNIKDAINELKSDVDAAASSGGASINDTTTSTSSVWSSSKTNTEIGSQVTAAVNGVVDGAPGAIDTLNELAAAIGDDANFAGTVTTALANRLRFDAAQTLTAPQQLQGCNNLGVGDPTTDFVTAFETALAA